MQEISIMENMMEKNVIPRKKNSSTPGDQLKCIQNKKPYSLDERYKYDQKIVRNKKKQIDPQ